jgi:hypothetical protein
VYKGACLPVSESNRKYKYKEEESTFFNIGLVWKKSRLGIELAEKTLAAVIAILVAHVVVPDLEHYFMVIFGENLH